MGRYLTYITKAEIQHMLILYDLPRKVGVLIIIKYVEYHITYNMKRQIVTKTLCLPHLINRLHNNYTMIILYK